MKRNVIIFFVTLIILEFASADPVVYFNGISQPERRQINDQEADDIRDDISEAENEDSGHVHKLKGDDTDDEGQVEKLSDGDSEEENYVARPLTVGDTFTARELLPVAEKLFEKIEHPGEGKGIVSSSTQPEELSDKLFKAFFMTSDRIVTLTATRKNFVDQPKEKIHKKIVDVNGQWVEINDNGNTSNLKVLTKQTQVRNPKISKTKNIGSQRRENKLIKKLGKNRHLVVHRKYMENNKSIPEKPPCRWSYVCKDPLDLDSCRLKENCTLRQPDEKVDHNQYIETNINEDPKMLNKFRKFLSINALDEEVEKIIEKRVLKYKPKNMGSAENMESLSEYFRKILVSSDKAVTTTIGEEEYSDTTEPIAKAKTKLKGDDSKVKSLKPENSDERRLRSKG
ncbi:myb-like protein X isoform X2 [Plodia interpunctella]|uniref:myb-like protein X isoform X2 n=1 Tax=Plodia interpunctella TaxID=58824 RepID=UPI00236881EF|nr:myb-like protein X isoform X2 [Plodia interpunctella]